MDLLNRYLQAVQFWLPKTQGQDIIAELAEAIGSKVEDQEAALGRELNEAEMEAILKAWGAPLMVAEHYLPQHYLIGPALFPVYRLVLKLALLFWVAPWIAVWICLVIFSPEYRAAHPGFILLRTWQSLWLSVISGFAFVTAGFALAERHNARTKFLEQWNPRKLPAVPDPSRIKRSSSIGELMGAIVVALWWLDVLRFPDIPGVRIALGPIWQTLYWPILLFYLATAALAAANSFRPWWTKRRAAIRLAIDCLGLVLAAILLAAGPWVAVSLPSGHEGEARLVSLWINRTTLAILLCAVLEITVKAFQDALRTLGKPPLRHRALRFLVGE